MSERVTRKKRLWLATCITLALSACAGGTDMTQPDASRVPPSPSVKNVARPENGLLVFSGCPEKCPREDVDLYVSEADGSDLRKLDTDLGSEPFPKFDYSPRWSPDGRRIVFQKSWEGVTYEGGEDLYLIDSDGGGLREFASNSPAPDGSPDWSPDGSQLVVARGSWEHSNLYVVDVDGSDLRQVTAGPGEATQPVFSPDGRWIAYAARSTDDDRHSYIVKIRTDGSGASVIARDQDVEFFSPDWAPRR